MRRHIPYGPSGIARPWHGSSDLAQGRLSLFGALRIEHAGSHDGRNCT